MKIKSLILSLSLLINVFVYSQTFTVTDIAPFATTNQNMWGAGGAFSINQDIELFRLNPATMTQTVGGITNIAGQQFGAKLFSELHIDIGSNFIMSGFSGGSIDVDFPVQVINIVPSDFTFEKGEWITIKSNYTLQNNAKLETHFPEGGSIELKFHFGFGANVHTRMCVFSCVDIPLIPPWSTTALLGAWPPVEFTVFGLYHDQATNTFSTSYPCMNGFLPTICNDTIMPIDLDLPDLGLAGFVEIPNTSTTSSINGNCLSAYGNSQYLEMQMDLLQYLSKMASFIPPPAGPPLAQIIGNLNNSFDLPGGANVSYNLFSAYFTIKDFNVQQFTYCPNVNTTLDFPTAVLYRVKDATSGSIIDNGFKSTITYHVGHDLEFKYPCNYEFVTLTPTYSIDSTENTFRNETYDSLDFSFDMSALAFSITIPKITILPAFPAFTICIPYGYPCGFWSWCSGSTCTTTPSFAGLYFGPFSVSLGPLWSTTIPVGSIKIPWFDQSWGLRGFNVVAGTPFKVKPRPYEVTLAGINVLCKNDATGSLTASVLNGTPPYNYEWDNIQVNTSGLTTNNINGLSAGIHFVKVTDANGCSVFASYTLTEPAQILSVANLVTADVKCFSGADGKATILMNGGTSPYAYNWSNGSVLDSMVNVSIGTYALTVTDANSCTLDTNMVIDQPDDIVISTVNIDDVLCKGNSTGNASINVLGGSPTYSYLWSNGATTQNLSNVPAGNYTVTVTDLNSCSKNYTLTVVEPTTNITIVSLIGSDVKCYNGNDGALSCSIFGGTSPYSYAWYNSTGIQLSSTSNSVNDLIADTYKLLITDANGCSTYQTRMINQPIAAINTSILTTDVNCYSGNDGTIDLSTVGGTTPYNFAWNNGATTEDINALTAANYTITITDANNCIYIDTAMINQPSDSLSIKEFNTTDILCFGDATGNIDITPFGGTLPYTYGWSSGQTIEDINNVPAGNYTLTITDGNNCVIIPAYTLTQPTAAINITNTFIDVSCFGGSDGSIDVTVTGGTQPYIYQWSNLDSVVLSAVQQDLTGLDSNIYTILVTDSNNCQLSFSIVISEPTAAVTSAISATAVNCYTGSDGSIDLTPTGGTAPYTFVWSNGATSEDVLGLTTGWYNVVITDSKLCVATDSIFVSEPSTTLSASTTVFDVNCFGGNDGGADLLVTGGTTPYSYLWSNGTTTQNIDSLTAGVYTITVVDANSCIANSGANIQEPATGLTLTNTVDSVSCYGYSDGHINIGITGGTMPYQIQWADSMFLLSEYANDLNNLILGQYTVIVTDGNNCETRQEFDVFEPDTLTISYTTINVTCFGYNDGSIITTVLGGTVPYSYLWNDTTTASDLNNLIAGNYSVTVADVNNCSLNENMKITQPNDIKIIGDVTEVSCKDATDGIIYVLATGGTGSFNYQWSSGELGNMIEELATGNYEVYVTDDNGCMDTLQLTLSPTDESCIQVANTITPNGDGLNDTWEIDKMELYPKATMQIFNKWGNLLFESHGTYIPWDGTYQGEPLPSATYYFILDLKDGSPAITGPITIVR